jgi:thiol-disulfide isomerase/thioredoxin
VKQALLSIAVAALFAAGCTKREPAAAVVSAPIRAPLELKLPRFPSGELYDLANDRGSVVLLDVWATWCEPCRDALPVYQRLLAQYGPRGFKVYAINVDEDSRQIAPFLQETKITLPVLVDRDADFVGRQLKVEMLPSSFILDRRGVIRYQHDRDGFVEALVPQYRSEIETLLVEKAQ